MINIKTFFKKHKGLKKQMEESNPDKYRDLELEALTDFLLKISTKNDKTN
jgi:hypothetical protein